MNLYRPPFQIIPGQSAEDTAADILHAFTSIEILPDKVERVFRILIECLDIAYPDPLAVAGCNLANAIDTAACIQNNPYHNSQHTCEVMLSAYFLSLLTGIDKQKTAEVVLAALIHDFQHDGKNNGDIPMRLERIAVNTAAPYLSAAGVTNTQQQIIAALILATNTAIGLPFAHACYTHHTHGGTLPEISSSAPELAELCNDRLASIQALILCDADILPSIGLTVEYALKLQEKLSLEWDTRLGLEDKLRFIDHQHHTFVTCNYFTPNIDNLKFEILSRLNKNKP